MLKENGKWVNYDRCVTCSKTVNYFYSDEYHFISIDWGVDIKLNREESDSSDFGYWSG